MSKQLIHTDSRQFGHKLTIPFDGTIQLGSKGEATVSERAAKVLLTIPFWVDPEAKPATKKKAVAETDEEDAIESKLQFEEEDENSGFTGLDLENLKGLELSELLEIAEMAGVKVAKAMQTNKTALVAFLKSKLKSKI